MGKRVSAKEMSQRETAWRDRLSRFAGSGQAIETFCRTEGVSPSNFYYWRKTLSVGDAKARPSAADSLTPFIDLGPVSGGAAKSTSPSIVATKPTPPMGIEVRIDLGSGVVLTIARR